MDYKDSLLQLELFAREVKEYYDRSKHLTQGALLISEQMVSLALPKLSSLELHAFIRLLEKKGDITVVEHKPLKFTPDFLMRQNIA
jgi:hypothetical protein